MCVFTYFTALSSNGERNQLNALPKLWLMETEKGDLGLNKDFIVQIAPALYLTGNCQKIEHMYYEKVL